MGKVKEFQINRLEIRKAQSTNINEKQRIQKQIDDLKQSAEDEANQRLFQSQLNEIDKYAQLGRALGNLIAATGNPELGKQTTSVVNITSNVAVAYAAFTTNNWVVGSTAALNAAAGLAELFGGGGVDPDTARHQQMMKALQKLHQDMIMGFNKIHDHLNQLGEQLFTGQAEIRDLLSNVIGKLNRIEKDVTIGFYEINNKLTDIEELIFDDSLSEDFQKHSELKIALREGRHLTKEDYNKKLKELITDLLDSADRLEEKEKITRVKDLNSLQGIVGIYPDTHGVVQFDYLINRVLGHSGDRALDKDFKTANPSLWVDMVSSLMTSRKDYPQYNLKHEVLKREDLKSIIGDGKNILQASFNLQTNEQYFKKLIADHRRATQSAKELVQSVEYLARDSVYEPYLTGMPEVVLFEPKHSNDKASEHFRRAFIDADPLSLFGSAESAERESRSKRAVLGLKAILNEENILHTEHDIERLESVLNAPYDQLGNLKKTTAEAAPSVSRRFFISLGEPPVMEGVWQNILEPSLSDSVKKVVALGIGSLKVTYDIDITRSHEAVVGYGSGNYDDEVFYDDIHHVRGLKFIASLNVSGNDYNIGETTYVIQHGERNGKPRERYSTHSDMYVEQSYSRKELVGFVRSFANSMKNKRIELSFPSYVKNPNYAESYIRFTAIERPSAVNSELTRLLVRDMAYEKNHLRNSYQTKLQELVHVDLNTRLDALNESAAMVQASTYFAFNSSIKSDTELQEILFGTTGIINREKLVGRYTRRGPTKSDNPIEAEKDWLKTFKEREDKSVETQALAKFEKWLFNEREVVGVDGENIEPLGKVIQARTIYIKALNDARSEVGQDKEQEIFNAMLDSILECDERVKHALEQLLDYDDQAFWAEERAELTEPVRDRRDNRAGVVELMYEILNRVPNSHRQQEDFSSALDFGPLGYVDAKTASIVEKNSGEYIFSPSPGKKQWSDTAVATRPHSFNSHGTTTFEFRVGEDYRDTWEAGLNSRSSTPNSPSTFHRVKVQNGQLSIEAQGGLIDSALKKPIHPKEWLEIRGMSHSERLNWEERKKEKQRAELLTSQSIPLKPDTDYQVKIITRGNQSELTVKEKGKSWIDGGIQLKIKGIVAEEANLVVTTSGPSSNGPSHSPSDTRLNSGKIHLSNIQYLTQNSLGTLGSKTDKVEQVSLTFDNKEPVIRENGQLVFRHLKGIGGDQIQVIATSSQAFKDHYKYQFQVTTDENIDTAFFAAGLHSRAKREGGELERLSSKHFHEVVFDQGSIWIQSSEGRGSKPVRKKVVATKKSVTYLVDIETKPDSSTIYVTPEGNKRGRGHTLNTVNDERWGKTRFEAHGKTSAAGNGATIAMDDYASYRNRAWTDYIDYDETGKKLGLSRVAFNKAIETLKNKRFWDPANNQYNWNALIAWMEEYKG